MFDATLAADLYLTARPTFDALVAPTLDEAQVAAVLEVVADRALDGAVKAMRRTLDPSVDDGEVRSLASWLLDTGALVDLYAAHKVSETWSGRVVRMPLADGRSLKVTITDAKK